jgi:hypothetical protein
MTITVGMNNIDNLLLPMHPVSKISGRIEFAEGVPFPANGRFLVLAEPANGDSMQGFASAGVTCTNAACAFSIPGLLGGTYLLNVWASGAGNLFPMSVSIRGRDVTDTGVDTSSATEIADVVVTMTNKRQEIRGVASGGPASRPMGVIAFPADRALWSNYGWDARRFSTTRVGSSGAFRLQKLPAGDYYQIAVDATRLNDWTDPRFLTAASSMGTKISVDWGESRSQDLTFKEVVVK